MYIKPVQHYIQCCIVNLKVKEKEKIGNFNFRHDPWMIRKFPVIPEGINGIILDRKKINVVSHSRNFKKVLMLINRLHPKQLIGFSYFTVPLMTHYLHTLIGKHIDIQTNKWYSLPHSIATTRMHISHTNATQSS